MCGSALHGLWNYISRPTPVSGGKVKNPALSCRLWRQGQESGTVVIQHIITKGTIDERIVKALSKKEMTQTALIDAVKADLEVV